MSVEVEVMSESIQFQSESIHPEIESIHLNSESIDESIRDKWMGANEALKRTGLTKSGFQRSISHLLGVRGCRVDSIRRGSAKNTRYSELAIALIAACEAKDEEVIDRLIQIANPPVTTLCVVEVDRVATLEEKIAFMRQNAVVHSQEIGSSIQSKLTQIALCNQANQQRSNALNTLEVQEAENRGIAQALEIFSAEEKAKEDTLAHLRALKISGNHQ
ncbi:MAG: hypothetical protein EAZ86_19240 [Oscillatoriales cyanobacterium]|nr:hypothetical protein [Microcoleus sp. PH2017_17_BER_D_A]TAE66773.1 MAG: hypothetical protein EAZ86_19240 [Oscillatoriales cyanobacterium]